MDDNDEAVKEKIDFLEALITRQLISYCVAVSRFNTVLHRG
jgi:hypothetical protein